MSGFNVVMRFVLAFMVVWSFLIIGCSANTTTINHSYSMGEEFRGLKNYKWIPASILVEAKKNSLVDENVRFIADQELWLKGFKKSDEKPDLWISIVYDYESVRPQYNYQLRMLTLNVYRSENKELIWQGTVYGIIDIDVASNELKEALKNILSKFPLSNNARLSELGFQLLQRGDYAEAEKYLDQAVSENPNNPYAILNLGVVYQNTGRDEKARNTYNKLIILNPLDVAVVSNQSGATGKKLVDIAKENLQKLK
jgi:tetratricopeptide (TPR) repeat protein